MRIKLCIESFRGRLAACGASILIALLMAACTQARAQSLDEVTQGGLRAGAKIVTVSTLEDSGPGSLREALELKGPRVVVFAVSGVIRLASDIDVLQPELSVLGQSAPDPGVVITGGSIRIRTRDVAFEHLSIFSGSSGKPEVDTQRDSLSIIGPAGRKARPKGILLLNLSLGWAPDENLSVVGGQVSDVAVAYSIVAEGLARSAHEKPNHSAGILIGPGAQSVTLYRNLLAGNQFRNPQIHMGSAVAMLNNVIFNPERTVVILDGDGSKDDPEPITLRAVNNVAIPTSQTNCGLFFISYAKKRIASFSGTKIEAADNIVEAPKGDACHADMVRDQPPPGIGGLEYASPQGAGDADFPLAPAKSVEGEVLRYSGSRPSRRSPMDSRIVSDVKERRAEPFDTARALPDMPASQAAAKAPNLPESLETPQQLSALRDYRCERHIAVGGAPFGSCARS